MKDTDEITLKMQYKDYKRLLTLFDLLHSHIAHDIYYPGAPHFVEKEEDLALIDKLNEESRKQTKIK